MPDMRTANSPCQIQPQPHEVTSSDSRSSVFLTLADAEIRDVVDNTPGFQVAHCVENGALFTGCGVSEVEGHASRAFESRGIAQPPRSQSRGKAKYRMSVAAGMMEPASLRHLLPERPCVLAGEGGLGKEVRAVSKPKGRRAHVRKGKVTARKVSDILNSIARLVRAVGVLVDALSKWIG